MKWSKASQRMALKLQEIERVRKRAAEAHLLDARNAAETAKRSRIEAQAGLGQAERDWQSHLTSGRLDLELGKAFAARLLNEQCEFDVKTASMREAELNVERKREDWQKLEAAVRSGEAILRRGRRTLLKRSQGASDHALSETTTWKWFRR